MNNIHVIFLRLLATSCLAASIAYPSYSQQNTQENLEPTSAVDLVDTQAILESIVGTESAEERLSVETPENDSLPESTELEPITPVVDTQSEPDEDIVSVTDTVTDTVSATEVPSLIDSATGLSDFNYDDLLGESGEWDSESFFEPVITKLTPNAMVSDETTTPDIYRAMEELLSKEDFPLSAEEKSALSSTYFDRNGELIFVTNEERMKAAEKAKQNVETQGLPHSRYENLLPTRFDPIEKMALAEIDAAAFTIRYGKDMERGIVAPNSMGSQFDIEPEGRSQRDLLSDFSQSKNANEFFMALEPNDPDYATLKAELAKYEELYLAADTANIPQVPDVATLKIGSEGEAVSILRQRLEVLGFKAEYPVVVEDEVVTTIAQELTDEGTTQSEATTAESAEPVSVASNEPVYRANVFDVELAEAVRGYQSRAGLQADGVAGPQTLKTINNGPRAQMAPLLVALERHRGAVKTEQVVKFM